MNKFGNIQLDKPHKFALPPVVPIDNRDPLKDYYASGGRMYGVARLHVIARNLPIFDCPLACLPLHELIWDECNMLDLTAHVRRVNAADLTEPILISWDGRLADGRHRVIKALMHGLATLPAKRLMEEPTPCHVEP